MSRNQEIFNESKHYFVAGASAGQRYNSIMKQPLYLDHAEGSKLYDVDGKEYIDYHTGAGAALFGHNHPRIRAAIEEAMSKGFFMNYDTVYHLELAKRLREVFPSAEKIRLANTGSEATQGAIRLARGYTGAEKVIKFDGHFHGMHESIWFNHNRAGQPDAHGEVPSVPDTQGFPKDAGDTVINIDFNDIAAVEYALDKYKGEVACVIVEPISYNCGCLEGRREFLKQLRETCTRRGVVLIFDEVICGLRMRPGSAQRYFDVTPDITTMAKGIGGGMPIAAIGGKAEIMDHFNPLGKVGMSGTYTGSLMPVIASIACLDMAMEPGFYDHIEAIGGQLFDGINSLFRKHGLKGHVRGVGARFAIYFGVDDPEADFSFREIAGLFDREMYLKFIAGCYPRGLWFHETAGPVSPAHSGITSAHSVADIDTTLERMDAIFAGM